MKILVVEDDQDCGFSYKAVLEDRGHSVISVNTGQKCLETYSDKLEESRPDRYGMPRISPFDAILLDYRLPDRNGLELAREILALNPHQRIIFVSAYLMKLCLKP